MSSTKSLYTKIYAGAGGVDVYANAISDIHQDNFEEGIFTGKGIYDLKVFSKILNNEIPENTVLSHDLLEGSYLRCGLATDIMLMDGCPYIFVYKLFVLDIKSIPTRGCNKACPDITKSSLLFSSGLFKICDIAPINSFAEFKTKSVSASSVIIYFMFGMFSTLCIVLALNGLLILPKIYSLN